MAKFDINIQGQTFEIDAPNEQALPEIVDTIVSHTQPPQRERALLSIPERAQFAFGDVPGRTTFLEEKFPGQEIGRTPEGVFQVGEQPIEPRGFQVQDIPGDIADVLDEIVRLGGQIPGAAGGAALGIPGGPPGILTGKAVGGGIGRGVGQVVVEGIGRTLGVREQEIPDILRDIRNEALIGAGGELGGAAVSKISKSTSNLVRKIADRFTKKVFRPLEQTIFNFTADIPKDSLARVEQRGARILSRRNMSNENLLDINRKIVNLLGVVRGERGREVDITRGKLLGVKDASIGVRDLIIPLNKQLRKLGIVDDTFQQIKDFGTDSIEKKLIDMRSILLANADKGLLPSQAQRLLDNIDDIVKFGKEGKLFVGTKENALFKTIRKKINDRFVKLSTPFKKAKQKFSEIARIQENLGTKIDVSGSGITTLDKLDATGKTFVKQQLQRLDDLLPENQKFMTELLDSLAARDFASSTLRAIRTNLLPAFAGGLLGGLPGVAAGAAISTPKVVGGLIGGRQLGARAIEAGISGIGRGVERITAPAVSALAARIGRQ